MQTFAKLLTHYMDDAKPKISANKVGNQIGITRQAVLNWRNGTCMPDKNHRDKVLSCAHFLGLTERQTNEFLLAAGFTKEYVDFPEAIFTEFLKELFGKIRQIRPYPVILLLTQANWDEPPYREALLTQAKKYYSPNNVLHIHLYSSTNNIDDEYFSEFGEQCGFNEVNKISHFEYALRERLKQTEQLFFLVSRFEQGSESVRENLARLLRSMSETYANRFHVILCGGEKLADMKYQHGNMSLLNHAKVEHWPELGIQEIYALRDSRFKELRLDDVIDQFLTISGAHPQLLNDCLELRQENPELSLDDYPQELSQRDYVWQAFTQLQSLNTSAQQQIQEWLQREDVGNAQPYILNPLLRQLYWKNLLVEREFKGKQRLCWRCKALRIAGNNILNSS
jgi:hypothetical protein